MRAIDAPLIEILKYLADRQGSWTCLWYGHFKDTDDTVSDVYYALPAGTPEKVALNYMKRLVRRGLSGGCDCGCRGDFEITDKGLAMIGRERTAPYSGY